MPEMCQPQDRTDGHRLRLGHHCRVQRRRIVVSLRSFTIHGRMASAPDMRLSHTAGAGRPQHLRSRRLLTHATANDPHIARRGRTLRAVSLAVESNTIILRWGSSARVRPGARRRQVLNFWHVAHLTNPRDIVPESTCPRLRFLARTLLQTDDLGLHLAALRESACLYDDMIENAAQDAQGQATPDSEFSQACVATLWRQDAGKRLRWRDDAGHRDRCAGRYLQVLGRLTMRLQTDGGVQKAPDAQQ